VDDLNPGLTEDTLFVGATRPPMRWGATYSALLFNMVFTLEAFLLTKNLLTLLLCVPIHGVCVLLCARDARFFDLVLLAARTKLPAVFANLRLWKASSYSPLAIDLPDRRGRRRLEPVEPVHSHGHEDRATRGHCDRTIKRLY
jgi:type IV secretion system protein VirB3